MNKQLKQGMAAIVAALAFVSAGAIAGGSNVSSGAHDVNKVIGRASTIPAGTTGLGVRTGDKGTVSQFNGRGSEMPVATAAPVEAVALGIEAYGRGGAPVTVSKVRVPVWENLAQNR